MSAERVAHPPLKQPLVARTKRVLIGRPRSTGELEDTLLSKTLALPIFSSDPISSVAYATEAAMAVLVGVSLSALHLVFPISIAIALLLAIVVLSYSQGVKEVMAAAPKQPRAAKVLTSAKTPAPPDGSKPAIESTGRITTSSDQERTFETTA